jgi:hypothetical protein
MFGDNKGVVEMMRIARLLIAAGALSGAGAAQAATIIIYTDPMTLSQYSVVLDTRGPDRAFLCMAPPADPNCTEVKIKRGR